MKKRVLLLLTFLLVLVSCSGKELYVSGKSGEKLPKFNLEKISGEKVLSSKLIDKNKKTLITIAAEWCPHCQVEAPEIQRFYDEYKDKANIIVIYSNNQSTKAKVHEFITKHGYTFPAYYDADGKITTGFNVEGFPFNMILDGDKVVKTIEGEVTYEDLKENLLK